MKGFRHIITACLLAVWGLSSAQVQARDVVTVFAAASLKEALDAVADGYGGAVSISYGGSAIMARQVAMGAPADVVILANARWMTWLAEDGAILTEQSVDLLGNSLVVVGPANDLPLVEGAQDLQARLGDGRLAIGQTTGVPAGIYGRAWLEQAQVWEVVKTQLAEVENVRVALALVARGEAPLGVVYGSDALAEPRVSVVYHVPDTSHPPIIYPAAITSAKGQRFLDYLRTDAAAEIFRAYGFSTPVIP